jgi:hypothetical protein
MGVDVYEPRGDKRPGAVETPYAPQARRSLRPRARTGQDGFYPPLP